MISSSMSPTHLISRTKRAVGTAVALAAALVVPVANVAAAGKTGTAVLEPTR